MIEGMLTLITVNFNSAEHTIGLLKSLERQTEKGFDVIVVDNDSTPEDRALLGQYASSSPLRLDIIYSDTNRGFSGGNNLAIRKALAQESQWVLLINPDTTVDVDFIIQVRPRLHEKPCIIGFPLDEGERSAHAGMIQWLRWTLPHRYQKVTDRTGLYIIGASMLIHRSIFEKIGFLDERYFLYFEDADF